MMTEQLSEGAIAMTSEQIQLVVDSTFADAGCAGGSMALDEFAALATSTPDMLLTVDVNDRM
jgi:hypothetical protein